MTFAAIVMAAMSVSAVRETQKIRPADPAPAAETVISLSCAHNEFCAFQIAVTAPSTGPVNVTSVAFGDSGAKCGSLSLSASLPTSSALIYREAFVDVTTKSNQDGLTGKWPDPLIPTIDAFYGESRNALPFSVPAGQTQAFWIEFLVPMDQSADTYTGLVSITADGEITQEIAVSTRVRAFTLPSTSSLGSAYGFDWDGPCVGHYGGYGGPNCDDAQLEALNALYFKDALNHRITISSLVYAPPIQNGAGDFTTFDSLYGPFLDGTVLTGKNTLAGAKLTTINYVGDRVAVSYAAWAAHFKAKGWFDRVFDYTCDEPPNGCNWSDIPTRAAIVHAGDPNFRTLTTTSIQAAQKNGVLSSLDILVPIINFMDGTTNDPYPGDQRANYDTFLAQPNKLLWMYQSCEPSSSCSNGTVDGYSGWPTLFIDESAMSNRMLQWMEFKYGVSADLYYDTTYAMSDKSRDAWATQYEFGNNGDGSIWYPGKPSVIGGTHDIPIESIRMKMLREGMQDYEYLHMLATLGGVMPAAFSKVVTSAGQYNADPAVLEKARLEMADEIESLLKAGDAGCGGGTSDDGGSDPIGDDGGPGSEPTGGCSCDAVGAPATLAPTGALVVLAASLLRRRRSRGE